MEEIGRLMNSYLRITEEEVDLLCLDKSMVEKERVIAEIGLVGKLLTKRPYHKRSLWSVMENLWKPGPGFGVQEIDRDIFFFSFGTEADRQYVLDREP